MKKNNYLEKLYNSKKPFIAYKVDGGYDLYTDFSKKFFLNNNEICLGDTDIFITI